MPAPDWLVARPIAHRGLHDRAAGRIENTAGAARAAIASGYAIECDVQLSADGEPMVFHDVALGRLTEAAEELRDRPAAELARLAVGGTADTIPRLGEFLALIAGRTPVVVEIKSRFDGDLALAERTAAAVAAYEGPLALKSFDPAVVGALARLAPGRPRGIVGESDTGGPGYGTLPPTVRHELAHLLHLGWSRPDFVSWRAADLPCAPAYLGRHLGGLPVMAWTVRTTEEAQRLRPHADQIVFEGFLPLA